MSKPQGTVGRVWLVGAGPGDPGLITVRGRQLLERADVVLHDRLVSAALLDLIPTGTLRLDVGKLGYARSVSQERINALLIGFARAGHDVVRLKGGDPFVFGRGSEEVIALREAGIPVEVVPGITSGVAGPAAAGIPVTHRGVARSVAFVTANTAPAGTPEAVDWRGLSAADTLVVFMAGAAARRTAAALLAAGRDPHTAAALIVDASLPTQLVLLTDLMRLAAEAPQLPAERPCLLVIGDVVALASRFQLAPPIGISEHDLVMTGTRTADPFLAANQPVSAGAPSGSGDPRSLRTALGVPPEAGSRDRP